MKNFTQSCPSSITVSNRKSQRLILKYFFAYFAKTLRSLRELFTLKTGSTNSTLFKKKIILYLYLLLFFFSSVLFSQNVTIKGIATGAEGKTLAVYTWSDQLTYTQKLISSGKIDSAGKFSFTLKTDKTFFAYLKIDFNQAPVYFEPGKTYNFTISCPDCKSSDDKTNPYLNPKELSVLINGSDSTELNNLIIRFNAMYDDFVYNNYISLIRMRNKSKIDSFRLKVDNRFGFSKNEYFINLVKYRFAAIEEFAQVGGLVKLAGKYFVKQPVLYDNTGYMEFFNNFFTNFLTEGSTHITKNDLYRTINEVKTFPALMDSLGKDTILKNEVLRELVALKGLGEMYYQHDYNRASILDMFKYVAVNSKFPQHKTIAENYLKLFTKLNVGTVAPDFTLKDFTGLSYKLAEFNKEKYVYLFFWTTWCVPCIEEMGLIGKLIEKYGTKVEFIGISADKEFMTYYYFMQNNKKFDFKTLHWGNNTELLENYNVKSYPTFVLIGPDNKIVQYPAEPPSGKLDDLLFDLIKISNKK